MNGIVIKTAIGQIQTGVSQYMWYLHDTDKNVTPIYRPINTSTYGNKMGKNNKIGL